MIEEGDCLTVRLPKNTGLPGVVSLRRQGDAVVLAPIKPEKWPLGFFDEIHISDPEFQRPEQGTLHPIKTLG